MSRLETRIERLEAAAPIVGDVPSAVVRFNPGAAENWLPDMFAALAWPSSLVALVTIDGRAQEGAAPEILVPPLSDDRLDSQQQSIIAQAGRHPGPWWTAIAGRNWSDALSMPQGEAALITELRRQRQRAQLGYGDEL